MGFLPRERDRELGAKVMNSLKLTSWLHLQLGAEGAVGLTARHILAISTFPGIKLDWHITHDNPRKTSWLMFS